MKAQAILACTALGAMVMSFFGCSQGETHSSTTSTGTTATVTNDPPPAFDPGAPQSATPQARYAEGPFGVGVGSVIPNFTFIGYVNAVEKNDAMQYISMSDFYNPHAGDPSYAPASPAEDDRLYPPGSQYGEGKTKPTVLSIDIGAVWCGPCNIEAKCVLPVHSKNYGACGGGLLLQLQDGPAYGEPATPKNLFQWAATKYKEDFPTFIDPAGRLGALFEANAFPQNIIIDTRTMKIVEAIAGVPDNAYWKKYESLLLDPSCPSQQPKCAADADCPTGTYCSLSCPANAITCIKNACQASGCKNQ
jgi:hypothetical protein